ncbi:MAG: glutamine-hydrolyzing carbamoyl-phosphate synthase small subunit [Archangiaceae bacterium]|nr:glutamine-hydrolyzing carbamoyl-phosphate synthase small subunit [Archangiaceae bacterium]
MKRAVLALADGSVFEGRGFGGVEPSLGEVVFNTSMSGYQEILTDPSYVGQIVTFAATQIGNVGTNALDEESARPHATGLVVRELTDPSNFRSEQPLPTWLARWKVGGIEGLDTRRLVRHLRTHGSQNGIISTESVTPQALVERAKKIPSMEGLDLATGVSTRERYEWTRPTPAFLSPAKATPTLRFHVVAIDYGLKKAMLQFLVDQGCRVTVVPAGTSADDVLALKPDGVFLTNGPGDPAAVVGADKTVAQLVGKLPLFGICLGHQILARALGAKTYKLKFGHRGANQPVQDLSTGRVEITSQNHGFAVDAKSLSSKARVTHVNLNDQTVEGLAVPEARCFSVQYHPEASPGPHDAQYLFKRFADLMAGQPLSA